VTCVRALPLIYTGPRFELFVCVTDLGGNPVALAQQT
jgi:hypothetical protein